MFDMLDLPSKPTPEQQKATREFLRTGLTNFRPVKVGSYDECLPAIAESVVMTKAANAMQAKLPHRHWFGSTEVYENGFNVFVRNALSEHAVAVWRFRT